MPEYQVLFYEKVNGDVPAEEYINSLEDKMSAKVYRLLTMLSQNGVDLREPYSKHLEDGIFELRAQIGSNLSRVLYFFIMGQRIIVTNGFTKKTQKTPRSEIEKAKLYRKDHLRREELGDENT